MDAGFKSTMRATMDNRVNTFYVPDFPRPVLDDSTLKLHQVADIDTLLGFKGNYMIFPVVNFNYMNWFMAKDYLTFTIDPNLPQGGTVTASDPDPLADLSTESLQAALQAIYEKDPKSFDDNEAQFTEVMKRMLAQGNSEIIVPSNSLYIEALPGTHPLLEDFKLIHRAIDVKKAQAEARHLELENLRLASRLENGQNEDPDIEKKIIVEGSAGVNVGTE
jgi:hypothetical protein